MLRVYGVTYDHTMNYGSCLQAYALQNAIENIETSDGQHCRYGLIPLWTCRDYPKKRLKNAVGLILMNMYRRSFVPFEKKYMHYVKCDSLRDLDSLNSEADAFVCGSDVIWNPDQNKGVSAYCLDFAKKYAFSYAASFGKTDITKEYLNQVFPYIKNLNGVSVREASAKNIVLDSVGISCTVTADPVVLLTDDQWNQILYAKGRKGHIFVYRTHTNAEIEETINSLHTQTGMKVIDAAWSASPSNLARRGVFRLYSPTTWLQLIRDAEYVVTNSFHATAFSVLFHKKFFTVVNGERDKGINVRMNDFLTALGLEDRIFSSVPDELDLSEIDYSEVDQRIEAMREEGLAYLRENLEEAYRQKTEADSQVAENRKNGIPET